MATSARLEELQHKFNENPRRYFAPLANEHRKLGDLDQAIALCRTHLPQQPQHVSGHIVLAQALFEAGNTPDARSTFEAALDLDPENLIALRYLGDIARAQGEQSTARQLYERVLDADPRNDEIAQLVREIQQGVPAAQVAEAEAAEPEIEAPSAEQEEVAASDQPNELIAEAMQPEASEPEPIEDLATAWQHEVAALETASESKIDESAYAELPVEEPQLELPDEPEPTYSEPESSYQAQEPAYQESEAVAEMELAVEESSEPQPEVAAEADFAPADTMESNLASADATSVPNEPWAEPDADFVASVPTVESSAPAEPRTFAEIDYSVFEAVADEEAIAAAPPPAEPAMEEIVEEPAAPYAETSYSQYDEPAPASEATVAAEHTDDWFASPSSREIETLPSDTSSEAAFDLDAAFQQVLPNNGQTEPEFEPLEVPQGAVAEFSDLPVAETEIPVETEAPAASEFALPPIDSGDGVDDAFAELDRMTASLESESEGSSVLLPDEQYAASAPTEEIEVPQHVDALIGRTPDSGVPAVEEVPAAFVTETMAELYLQQGFREEALAVYRQLLVMNPDDAVLAGRVAALEGKEVAAAEVSESADLPAFRYETAPAARPDALGQSVRAFLGVFARRRAPMRRRERAARQPEAVKQPESPLSALFGAPQGSDDASAAVLAGAFAAPNGEPLPGRPTRAAVEELRLGDVFGKTAPASAPRAASFDEFFSSGSAEQPAQSPLDEEGSDMVQFTAWLEGLKKK
jgi:tetratricopeptide (TPR) repeat protein